MSPAERFKFPLLALLLVAATLATFWPLHRHEFINYDDPDYILLNEHVNQGLNWAGIKWAFTNSHASNWHPVTWISHMADVSFFGLEPRGHHLVNLLFHCLNGILLFLLVRKLTGDIWSSGLVAALFALHPLHVESVAWVSERKDVLSALFGLLTLITYARYVSDSQSASPKAKVWYGAALALFALGLMSKPMLVTWPFLLLLLDFWPLQRIPPAPLSSILVALGKLVREKIPFFLLALASCVVTLKVQQNAMASVETVTLSSRIENALLAYTGYLTQTVWPARLAIFYPHGTPPAGSQILTAFVILLTATGTAIACARRFPVLFTGWFWFLGTLIPVIGLVQVGGQARADRYTYLPLIGIFLIVGWLARAGAARSRLHKSGVLALCLGALGVCTVISRRQLQYWQNSETLFTHALNVTQGNYIARAGLGIIEFRREKYDLAIQHLEQALEMVPPGTVANQIRYYIGATLQKQGKGMAALPYFMAAPDVGTLQPEREYRLALSQIEAGQLDEAEQALELACAARPDNPDFILGKAALLHRRGKNAAAESILRELLARHPTNALAHSLFAKFLVDTGRPAEAAAAYAQAETLRPDDVSLRQSHAAVLLKLGRTADAIRAWESCVAKQPRQPELHAALGEILIQTGETRRGIAAYERALQLDPDYLSAINNLAWVLATHRDPEIRNGRRAVQLGEHARQLTRTNVPVLLGTLAAAYAEAGQFEAAVATATQALELAVQQQQPEVARRNEELLNEYKAGRPVRD